MTSEGLRKELRERITALRAEGRDKVDIDEVERTIEAVLGDVDELDDLAARDQCVRGELGKLVLFIRNARSAAMSENISDIRNDDIPLATDALDAIVRAAEEATHGIIDATEKIESMVRQDAGAHRDRILGQITRTFEACSFQDITGQRVSKVINTLKHIESTVDQMIALYDDDGASAAVRNRARRGESSDRDWLNGPQLPENAPDQSQIDKLFADLD